MPKAGFMWKFYGYPSCGYLYALWEVADPDRLVLDGSLYIQEKEMP
jgi:hypothetical protein